MSTKQKGKAPSDLRDLTAEELGALLHLLRPYMQQEQVITQAINATCGGYLCALGLSSDVSIDLKTGKITQSAPVENVDGS